MGVWYATRERVRAALEVNDAVAVDARIDAAIEASSRGIDDDMNARLYPRRASYYYDYPTRDTGYPWRLWLGESRLISLESLVVAGSAVPLSAVQLEPNRTGPPYTRIELDQSRGFTMSSGSTWQRSAVVTGWWGVGNDLAAAGTLTASVGDTVGTLAIDSPSLIGVGSLIIAGDEYMTVSYKTWFVTPDSLSAPLTASASDRSVPVASSAAYGIGETLLIGNERVRVTDLSGNTLIVRRAVDGTVLAAHTATTAIYALRTAVVERGQCGTEAIAHTSGTAVSVWRPPALLESLCVARSINQLIQEGGGYTRVTGSGDSARDATAGGLAQLEKRAYAAFGNRARTGAV